MTFVHKHDIFQKIQLVVSEVEGYHIMTQQMSFFFAIPDLELCDGLIGSKMKLTGALEAKGWTFPNFHVNL